MGLALRVSGAMAAALGLWFGALGLRDYGLRVESFRPGPEDRSRIRGLAMSGLYVKL